MPPPKAPASIPAHLSQVPISGLRTLDPSIQQALNKHGQGMPRSYTTVACLFLPVLSGCEFQSGALSLHWGTPSTQQAWPPQGPRWVGGAVLPRGQPQPGSYPTPKAQVFLHPPARFRAQALALG